ncbi:hypothetical protein AK812_SmicGene34651 [Symbiodinium microadriaticum]|uniref:Uncharacterized protein n=1 Tax=Symbiodinium microadriaticum TaxID=2951 RepID=A0A1Q9CNG7_SYMMI|nr:hypothetical protein AK812_SmicGene34651 [Symbiodinium microadriaticum]CAE7867464.1 unnamed protein product [Symbiodinium sp. KB8]
MAPILPGDKIDDGIFKAATALHVASDWLCHSTEPSTQQEFYDSLQNVEAVDMFISHSWSDPAWMKFLSLCQFLNFNKAILSAFSMSLGSALILLMHAGSVSELHNSFAGTGLLSWFLCYLPVAVFFLVYFLGHTLSRRTFWFDRICVHQENLDLKAKTIDALPHFVANSREMLILLDETYLERLWCNLEVAVFSTTHSADPNAMHLMPSWLPVWVLSTVVTDFLALVIMISNYPTPTMEGSEGVQQELDRSAFIRETFLAWWSPTAIYAIYALPSFVLPFRRLQLHDTLLARMAAFDHRDAKCKMESDRAIIMSHIANLAEGYWDPLVSVEFGGYESPAENAPLVTSNTRSSNPSIHAGRFHATEEVMLDEFNAYIRGPMRDKLEYAVGGEIMIPWTLSASVSMPFVLGQVLLTFDCEFGQCEVAAQREGFASADQYFICNIIANVVLCLLSAPQLQPLLLRMLRFIRANVQNVCLQYILGAVGAFLVYNYVFGLSAAVGANVLVNIAGGPRPESCLVACLGVIYIMLQGVALFSDGKAIFSNCLALRGLFCRS